MSVGMGVGGVAGGAWGMEETAWSMAARSRPASEGTSCCSSAPWLSPPSWGRPSPAPPTAPPTVPPPQGGALAIGVSGGGPGTPTGGVSVGVGVCGVGPAASNGAGVDGVAGGSAGSGRGRGGGGGGFGGGGESSSGTSPPYSARM